MDMNKGKRSLCVIPALLALVLAMASALGGCGEQETTESGIQENGQAENGDIIVEETIDDGRLREDMNVYSEDDPDGIVYFYMTVRIGNEGAGTSHTFDEVENAVRFLDSAHVDNNIYAEVLVQVGDNEGPKQGMLGRGETTSNASIRIRGDSSSIMLQRSYKLALSDNTGLWREQSNTALDKHIFDTPRFRDKLYFDLTGEVPEVSSIRTRFTRLFIKDETAEEEVFTDYRLYTQAGVPTKKYLSNHGLDRSSCLYKTISFNLEPNEFLENSDDEDFDLKQTETIVKYKGREDNGRSLELTDVINDNSTDINEIIDTCFDRDNYENWLLLNILMGNIDTTVQNFYLHNPLDRNKWYFIPWDFDTSLYRGEREIEGGPGEYDDWKRGISNYWGVILRQRYLKNEKDWERLKQKADEMHQWLDGGLIDEGAAQYNAVMEPFINQIPDLAYLGSITEERSEIIVSLGDELEENYRLLEESLGALMPSWIYEIGESVDVVKFNWGSAYGFQAKDIAYHVWINRCPDIPSPIVDQTGLTSLSLEVSKQQLRDGVFYWRVQTSSEDGRIVCSMNKIAISDTYYSGVMRMGVR